MHERHRTGRGVSIDIGMADSAMSWTAIRHGFDLDRDSRDHLWPTNDVFETADGRRIALGIVEEKFWNGFVAAARDLAPDLASPDWASEPKRRERGDVLAGRMRDVMGRRDQDAWMAIFTAHDVPAQRVLTPDEAARSPQAAARDFIVAREGERHIPFPVRVDDQLAPALRWTAEEIGASTDAVLKELAFGPAEIASMRDAGALGRPAAVGEHA